MRRRLCPPSSIPRAARRTRWRSASPTTTAARSWTRCGRFGRPSRPRGGAEFALLLKQYGVGTVLGDRYAGEWPRERFRQHSIEYGVARQSKAELCAAVLPLLNSGRVELLDEPRLVAQLCGLERRTAWGGRDSIDHGPGGRDDLANAVAGALVAAAEPRRVPQIRVTAIRVPIRRPIRWSELE